MAKSTPAMGALNVPPMAAPAPAATMIRTSLAPNPATWPTVLPMEDPIWTMGPSRPTDPPDPMEIADPNALTMATRGRMRPPRCRTANWTSGIPCPWASGAQRRTIQDTTTIPTAGARTRGSHSGSMVKTSKRPPA